MKENPYMKNVVDLLYHYFARIPRNLSPVHTDLACKGWCIYTFVIRRIRKNPNPFPIWKIRFGLYWFGAPSGARTLGTLIKSQVLYQLS